MTDNRYAVSRNIHYVVFDNKADAEEYLNKYKNHPEYMCIMRQHSEGDWYVEIRRK